MLALKKKRETEAKAKAEAEAAAAASPGGGAAEKVSILGIGGKKKKDGGKGGAGGSKKRTPGEIRIQKGETEHACVSYVSDCGVSLIFLHGKLSAYQLSLCEHARTNDAMVLPCMIGSGVGIHRRSTAALDACADCFDRSAAFDV